MGATGSPWTAPQPEDSAAAAHVLVTHDHGLTERSPLEGLDVCVQVERMHRVRAAPYALP